MWGGCTGCVTGWHCQDAHWPGEQTGPFVTPSTTPELGLGARDCHLPDPFLAPFAAGTLDHPLLSPLTAVAPGWI